MIHTVEYAIIGAGLSGAYLANRLAKQQANNNFVLLEALPFAGGRLRNDHKKNDHNDHNNSSSGTDEIDLGGAWIWPDYQPLMKRLVYQELHNNIKTMEQWPRDGSGSIRIQGGAVQIVRSLLEAVPSHQIRYNTAVTACKYNTHTSSSTSTEEDGDGHHITLETNTGETFLVRKAAILCVPPKVAHKTITFDPPLSAAKQRAMNAAHTWMAGVTKVALVYEHAFWKNDPRASYNRIGAIPGPIFQLYDASTENINALTMFTLLGPLASKNNETEIIDSVKTQLGTLWTRLGLQDLAAQLPYHQSAAIQQWPLEPYLSENPNPTTIQPHPEPVAELSKPEMDGKLHFGATETDQRSPGVMEGAIGAAIRVLRELGIEY